MGRRAPVRSMVVRYRVIALLIVSLALLAGACGKGRSSGNSGGKPAIEAGSQGCIVPKGAVKLCGEDAEDWCKSHTQAELSYGDCTAILPKPAKPQENSQAPSQPEPAGTPTGPQVASA